MADRFIAADVATVDGTDTIIKQVADGGGVDIIIHVAGGGLSAPSGGFAKLAPELWDQTLQLNLLAAVRIDRSLIPAMIDAAPAGKPPNGATNVPTYVEEPEPQNSTSGDGVAIVWV